MILIRSIVKSLLPTNKTNVRFVRVKASIVKARQRSPPEIRKTPVPITKLAPAPLPSTSIEFPVIDFFTKQKLSTLSLKREIFGAPLRTDILHRVVVWQLNKRRTGNHKGKTRAETRGGGRKPWKQKGSGRARAGSLRAPQFKGGGAVFPPVPRSHATDLPRKIRAFGMRVALSTKLAQKRLMIVDNLQLPSHKTKDTLALVPKTWRKTLIVDDEIGTNLRKSTGNLDHIDVLPQIGLNVHDILAHDTLVLTKNVVTTLQDRIVRQMLGPGGRNRVRVLAEVKASKEQAEKQQISDSRGQQQQALQ